MKRNTKRNCITALMMLCTLIAKTISAQDSSQILKLLRQAYNSSPKPEISFEQFSSSNWHVYAKNPQSQKNATSITNLIVTSNCNNIQTFCGNGDFENGTIDQTQWLGAYGVFSGVPNPATMTDGFMGGALTNSDAHQTVVAKTTDPITGISTTPLNGGNYSVRIGNTAIFNGTELMGKRIKIDSSTANLSFSYSVVFQDPGHAPADQPAFTVRVFDCATGAELPNVCDLGNGANKIISDSRNPFFQSKNDPTYGLIAYRDWTRGELFLSNYIGKTVVILFINNDCNLGGHFGYTYFDNICQTTAFLREPSNALKGNGVVLNDINALSNLVDSTSLNRYGVSADGITKLLVIRRSANPQTFTLSSAKDGSLSTIGNQATKGTTVNALPIINSKGESVVMAVYTAPDSYGTTQALDKNGRIAKITVGDQGNASTNQDLSFNIFTPPVVLVHGMWSKPAVWQDGGFYQSLKNLNFSNVELADYSNLNYTTFMPNSNPANYPSGVKSLYTSVPKAIRFYKNSSIAVSQVDVVGHSLGGLMTRSFTQTPEYKSNLNFSQGFVHKLITLGTPHLGSPLGPFLYDRRNNFIWIVPLATNAILKIPFNVTLGQAMALAGQPIGSAHQAFTPGSSAYQALTSTDVKSFAIAGNYKPDETTGYHDLTTLMNVIQVLPPTLDNLIGDDHDLIVGVKSQKGGLSNNFDSTYSNTVHSKILRESDVFGNQIRTETNSPAIRSKSISLLLSDDSAAFAPAFPAPSTVPAFSNFANQAAITAAQSFTANDYIRITSPIRGTTKLSNSLDSVTLTFTANGKVSPSYGIFLVSDIGMFTAPTTPPYQVKFALPHNTPVGKVSIVALARDTSGAMFGDTASIFISPAGSITNFTVTPDDLLFDSLYNQQRLSVTASFVNFISGRLDSSFADITNTELGTVYSTTKGSSVIKIDNKGFVSALGVGTDSVIINFRGNVLYVPVKVTSTCSVPKPKITVSGLTLTSSSPTNNQWFLNNILIDSAIGSTYNAIEPGFYSVQVTAGCSSPMSDTVFVMPTITCNLSAIDLGPNKTVNLFFADSNCTTLSLKGLDSSALSSYTFSWSTGETTSTVKVCPTITTKYYVTVKKDACTITDSVTVFVEKCPKDLVAAAPSCSGTATLSWKEPIDIYPATINIPHSLDLTDGSLILLDTLGGHGYYKSTNTYLWPDARDISGYIGGNGVNGHLVTITTAAENQFVWDHIKNTNTIPWIGLYNTGKVGNFKWVNNEALSYTNWVPGEPNNHGGDPKNIAEPYVQMYSALGQWNDDANENEPFIAEFEKPLIRYKQISGPANGSTRKPGNYMICYQRNNLITDVKDTCCFMFTVTCPPLANCPKDTVITVASCTNPVKINWTEPTDTFPATIQVPSSLDPTNGTLTYLGALDGHGYYSSNNTYLWPVARDISFYVGGNGVNGHLVTITTAAENQFVWDHIKNTNTIPWIGLFNTGKVGNFKWLNNETLGYTNWVPGEPNNHGGDPKNIAEPYVQMYSATGQWNDDANENETFVTEFEKTLIRYKQITGPTNGSMQKPGVYLVCYQRTNLITDEKDTCCFTVTISCSGSATSFIRSAIAVLQDEKVDLNQTTDGELKVAAFPNPSSSQFTLNVTSGKKEKITLQIFDMIGRAIEIRDGIAPNQTLQIGGNLNSGVYFVHVKQGTKDVVVKLMKQSH